MAISFTPGQVVSWDDLNALMAQHGSPGGAKSVTKVERKPLTKEQRNAIEDAGGDPDAPEQDPTYRYFFEDGSYVDAKAASRGAFDEQGRPKDTFQIVDYKPSAKYQEQQRPQSQEGTPIGSRQTTDQQGNTVKITTYRRPDGTTYERTDTVSQAPKPATRTETPVQVGGKNLIKVDTADPATGQAKTVYLDPTTRQEVQPPEPPKPTPTAVSAPPNQKWIPQRDPQTQEITYTKNPNYTPPSQIVTDPATGRMREITEDENGKPIVRDVTVQTTIKPSDIPVLQAKYGQISQGLGNLLADLNGRVSRGEMTTQERDAAFKAAHQQASTQVEEMNSILENSRSIWTQEIAERSHQYTEAANRRSFAGSLATNAFTTGARLAESSGPGHGEAIARGVAAMMDMGQKYAAGMGGFPSMAPIGLPPALQQARGMSLPGFGEGGAPGGPPPGGPPPGAAPPATTGISNTTDAGGVPRVYTPASSTTGSGLPPGGAAPSGVAPTAMPPPFVGQHVGALGTVSAAPPLGLAPAGSPPPSESLPSTASTAPQPYLGQPGNPTLMGMGAGFGAGADGSPIGVPAAIGGGGSFDPSSEGQGMLAASLTGGYGGAGVPDPAWEEAVRRAMQGFGGYG